MTRARQLLAVARAPVATARVAAWAWAEVRRLTSSLREDGIDAVDSVRPPPLVAPRQRPVVGAVLARAGATCLVRAAVLQRWDAHHGRPRPLIVGVARKDGEFGAHAWLEGDDPGGFVELHRRLPA